VHALKPRLPVATPTMTAEKIDRNEKKHRRNNTAISQEKFNLRLLLATLQTVININ
jgi:hypothetical protein